MKATINCIACGKVHDVEIERNEGLVMYFTCPETGAKMKGKAEIEVDVEKLIESLTPEQRADLHKEIQNLIRAKKWYNRISKIADNKKFWFWWAIFFTAWCYLFACVDFVQGQWPWGIIMIVLALPQINAAIKNADY